MKAKSFILASAAAALFVSGGALTATAADQDTKVKCEGANGCKGQSACKTAENDCAGHNSCKGKGFVMTTQQECDAAKADE